MKKIEFTAGDWVYFKGEGLPMQVQCLNDRFAVLTRELNIQEDKDLLEHEVKRGAYISFSTAWQELKNETVYSCLDLKNLSKGPHNLTLNPYDFKSKKSMLELLSGLTSGDVELSRRHSADFEITNTRKTLK